MGECIFCRLGSGRAPGRIVYRDESAFAFFPLDMEIRGHTVVAPLNHVASWPDVGEQLLHGLFVATQEISRRLCARLGARAVNVLFAGGLEAQQSIDHFHIHVLPRWRDDGVDAWPQLPGYTGNVDDDFRALTEKS